MITSERIYAMTSYSTVSGAGVAIFGALTLTQWLAIGGFILAVLGFGVNAWRSVMMVRLRAREVASQERSDQTG